MNCSFCLFTYATIIFHVILILIFIKVCLGFATDCLFDSLVIQVPYLGCSLVEKNKTYYHIFFVRNIDYYTLLLSNIQYSCTYISNSWLVCIAIQAVMDSWQTMPVEYSLQSLTSNGAQRVLCISSFVIWSIFVLQLKPGH